MAEVVNDQEQIVVRVISTHNSSLHLSAYAWLVDPLEEFKIKYEFGKLFIKDLSRRCYGQL